MLVKVRYTVEITQELEVPEDEIFIIDYDENLVCNLDPNHIGSEIDMSTIKIINIEK